MSKSHMAVGEVARRSGLPVSTLHFYERQGLIASERSAANHRLFHRSVLRRVSIIKVAQSAGVPLAEIAAALSGLPKDEVPTTEDWESIAGNWHAALTRRIEALTALRDKMALCIGCGCLSVTRCPLVNADDRLSADGPGPRLLEGSSGLGSKHDAPLL